MNSADSSLEYPIQPSTLKPQTKELRQSLQTLLDCVLEIYNNNHGRGKTISAINLDFNQLQLDHRDGYIELPEGRTSIRMVTTNADGTTDRRTWNSSFIISQLPDNNRSVYSAKLDSYIAGQQQNGEWELVGQFNDLLDESPQDRVIRMIQDRWETDGAWSQEHRAEMAAEEILLLTSINMPREFGDYANSAIEALEKSSVRNRVSPQDSIEKFKQLPEFTLAKSALAIFIKGHEDGIEEAIIQIVNRNGTTIHAYELNYDPIEETKDKRNYRKMIEISAANIDSFGSHGEVPQLEDKG